MTEPQKAAPRKAATPIRTPGKSIAVLMGEAMAMLNAVGKDGRNNQQNYDFRGIDGVVNAVGPVFRALGIVGPVPHKTKTKYRDVQTSTGKSSREVTVKVVYRFYGPAGDFMKTEVPGESMDFGDKGTPKSMSVAMRIALLQVLCIPTHSVEPDAQSYERAASPAKPEPSGRDWLAEAALITDVEVLKALGNECHAFGEFVSDVKRGMLARRQELSAPASAA